HLAAHDVVERAAGRVRPLPGEHLVVVAVIGLALLARAITLGRSAGAKVAARTLVFAGLRRPVEAVLLAGLADDALRVDAVAGDAFVSVFLLRVDKGECGLDRAQLVAADAAEENF